MEKELEQKKEKQQQQPSHSTKVTIYTIPYKLQLKLTVKIEEVF